MRGQGATGPRVGSECQPSLSALRQALHLRPQSFPDELVSMPLHIPRLKFSLGPGLSWARMTWGRMPFPGELEALPSLGQGFSLCLDVSEVQVFSFARLCVWGGVSCSVFMRFCVCFGHQRAAWHTLDRIRH